MAEDYNGWKNRATWNVMLWIENTESYYKAAVEFMKDYKGDKPYLDFVIDCGLSSQLTGDSVSYQDINLDHAALNFAMNELKAGGIR